MKRTLEFLKVKHFAMETRSIYDTCYWLIGNGNWEIQVHVSARNFPVQQGIQLKLTCICRLILRCRQDARARFAALRSDVQVKLELLDNKHVQHVVQQLQRLLSHLTNFYDECHKLFTDQSRLFPIEVDLAKGAFTYESMRELTQVANKCFNYSRNPQHFKHSMRTIFLA